MPATEGMNMVCLCVWGFERGRCEGIKASNIISHNCLTIFLLIDLHHHIWECGSAKGTVKHVFRSHPRGEQKESDPLIQVHWECILNEGTQKKWLLKQVIP